MYLKLILFLLIAFVYFLSSPFMFIDESLNLFLYAIFSNDGKYSSTTSSNSNSTSCCINLCYASAFTFLCKSGLQLRQGSG